jgi:hypothetical protein
MCFELEGARTSMVQLRLPSTGLGSACVTGETLATKAPVMMVHACDCRMSGPNHLLAGRALIEAQSMMILVRRTDWLSVIARGGLDIATRRG